MNAGSVTVLRCYHFVCPACGTSDRELGELGSEHDIHCVVCLIEDATPVRLRRWMSEDDRT